MPDCPKCGMWEEFIPSGGCNCNQTTRTERKPTCPKCGHGLTDDEMHDSTEDLWGLAPKEERTEIRCPACGVTYHCQGSYRPEYTTALNEDDL